MTSWHGNIHKRKSTGGKKRAYRERRNSEKGSFATETFIGEHKTKVDRRLGNNKKIRLITTKYVNVSNSSNGETKKVEILRVLRNPASVDYDRRDVITKGTVLMTSLGTARVTSRTGQSGVLNAILTKEKK